MKRSIIIFSIVLLIGTMFTVSCKTQNPGFAIVIDKISLDSARTEVNNYIKTVESRKLHPILIEYKGETPESLKNKLIQLYKSNNNPIEGVVFIGDIPIPMIRDAQHFTSAFKMNQEKYSQRETSVPSDRFYDDFDLKFRFIEKDKENPQLYYYSLKAEGAQKLRPEIYSARICPHSNKLGNKYKKLKRYLAKAVSANNKKEDLDNILFFSGHGFISESIDARIDEKIEFYEQFPWLKKQQKSIEYIDHSRDDYVKERLTNELRRKDLDFAVLHHHGMPQTQYFDGEIAPENIKDYINHLKRSLRESCRRKHRYGKSEREAIKQIAQRYPKIPSQWYNNSFDKKIMDKDSKESYKYNLHFEEFKDMNPNAKFVILDACYNGAFADNENIANAYIFSESGTIAVLANSVNVLQDKWVNRFVGSVGLGMRLGHLSRLGAYLECHIIGDPTYCFSQAENSFDINKAIISEGDSFWKNQLSSNYPSMVVLAMNMLSKSDKNYSDIIYNTFLKSQSAIVRLSAMIELSEYNDDNFINCLTVALNDSHEMTRRFAANFCSKSGDKRLIASMVSLASKNNTSPRVEFAIQRALSQYDSTAILSCFDKYFESINIYKNKQSVAGKIRYALAHSCSRFDDEYRSIADTSKKISSRISAARMLRNNQKHGMVDLFLKTLSQPNKEDVKLHIALWEAMGWFNLSYKSDDILSLARTVSKDKRFDTKVRDEALKTANRLSNKYKTCK